jgi:hypothetical protein
VSRPSSERGVTSTPLDDVKEYEPLFPEDEDQENRKKRRSSQRDEDGPRHQFRSKDVWEDTPNSLLYETTVDTPQSTEHGVPAAEHEPRELFETAGDEQARKEAIPPVAPKVHTKSIYNKDILSDMNERPSVRHRFPSQDTWEDAPDSSLHTAELDDSDNEEVKSPAESKQVPTIPLRPVRSKEGTSPTDAKKSGPIVPDRPKPQIPTKEKPAVPNRPFGSKIAALQSGFMADLNKRLQTGPQAVPKTETEPEVEEKAPLTDARKGRARGPARRKPAGGDAASGDAPPPRPKVSFVSAVTIWSIDEEGVLTVGSKLTPPTADKESQTGVMEIESRLGDGTVEKSTVYVDGNAPHKGNVVVKDGEERVDLADEQ